MAEEFKFPDVGEGITEGEIVKWHVKPGDKVKEDDTLVDMETAKAIVQIPSPNTGTILEIRGKPGDIINVGDVLVVFGEKGEKVTKTPAAPKPAPKRKSVGVIGELKEAKDLDAPGVNAMPAVRNLAKNLGVDLNIVKGTGTAGRISIKDVKLAAGGPKIEAAKAPSAPSETTLTKVSKALSSTPSKQGEEEVIPIKGVRKVIAEQMHKSVFSIPHVTHIDEVDITHLVEIRTREKAYAEKKGVKLTYLPFIIKAVIAALKEHPKFNASVDEKVENVYIKHYYNIGIAVDTKNGLIVPNIKDADKKKVLKIAKEIFELADKTRNRTVTLDELQHGTFTITNYGGFGGLYATPIINYPEVANLGIGKIIDKPVVHEGEIKIRKILHLSLSFDHRVIDGADAAKFTNTIMKYLADPDLFLVES
jgi:pyruvate dehydrogenase E2 component (dihydrolipoamide acetyltransferase)